MELTLRHGRLLRNVLEREMEKKKGRPRLEYFGQIIRDMRCESFREVKELACDRAERRREVVSNHS